MSTRSAYMGTVLIDPLDPLQREDAGVLDPKWYELVDNSKSYDVTEILCTMRVGEALEAPEHDVVVASDAHLVCRRECSVLVRGREVDGVG